MPVSKEKYTAEEYFAYTPESNEHCELVDGEIVAFASPGRIHQEITGEIYAEIRNFIKSNKGGCKVFVSPFDVKLDDYNVVQPDVFVVCDSSKINDKRCDGVPDFIVEVISTNRSDDIVRKLALYSQHGVREYWIADPKNEKTIVYFFEKNDFPNIYTFDTDIPVGIYDGRLSINIAELLK